MAFKVNYGLQRAERARAKEAKKEERARSKQAAKAAGESGETVEGDAGTETGTGTVTDGTPPASE